MFCYCANSYAVEVGYKRKKHPLNMGRKGYKSCTNLSAGYVNMCFYNDFCPCFCGCFLH